MDEMVEMVETDMGTTEVVDEVEVEVEVEY